MILFKENKNVILYNKIAKINTHIIIIFYLKNFGGRIAPWSNDSSVSHAFFIFYFFWGGGGGCLSM